MSPAPPSVRQDVPEPLAGGPLGTLPAPPRRRLAAAAQTLLGGRLARARAESWGEILMVPGALLILGTFLAIDNQYFLTKQNVINILLQGADLACLSFGMTFVVLAAELDLSVGAGAALASVVGAFVIRDTGSIPVGALAGIGVGVAIGTLNGAVVTLMRVPSFIVTLGTMVIGRGLSLALTNGSVVTGLPASVGNLTTSSFLTIPWMVWIVYVGLLLVLMFVQSQTTFGLRVFAVGGNREAARISGIPINRTRVLCFVISGFMMGIAGLILTARVQSGQPSAATGEELYAVAAIVLGGTSLFGGRGSVTRTLWGVLFIVTLQNGLDLLGVGDDLKQVVIGTVLIVAASTDFLRTRLRRRRASQSSGLR